MIRSYFLREYRLTMQTGHSLCSVSAFLCETRDFQSDINNNLNCHFYERINKNFLFPSLLHIRDCNDAMRCSNFCRLKYFSAHEPQPEKAADVSRRHCWFPREMSSKKRAQNFHADDVSLPRTVGSVSESWCREGTFLQATRSSAHIWAVTRHQYGITAIVPQTSFGKETSGGVFWILGQPRPHKASENSPWGRSWF